TPNAAEKLRELLSHEAEPTQSALRLAVRHGCCSDYQYALGFDQARDDDHAIASEGLTNVVDPQRLPSSAGARSISCSTSAIQDSRSKPRTQARPAAAVNRSSWPRSRRPSGGHARGPRPPWLASRSWRCPRRFPRLRATLPR